MVNLLPELNRGDRIVLPEIFDKVGGLVKAECEPDLLDRVCGVGQESFGFEVHPLIDQLFGGFAQYGCGGFVQAFLCDMELLCIVAHLSQLVEMLLEEVPEQSEVIEVCALLDGSSVLPFSFGQHEKVEQEVAYDIFLEPVCLAAKLRLHKGQQAVSLREHRYRMGQQVVEQGDALQETGVCGGSAKEIVCKEDGPAIVIILVVEALYHIFVDEEQGTSGQLYFIEIHEVCGAAGADPEHLVKAGAVHLR